MGEQPCQHPKHNHRFRRLANAPPYSPRWARGLAFLHQGWVGTRAPVVHGHLVPSNILLGDDLEPRISDFAVTLSTSSSGASAEDDGYSYGVLVMELVTGLTKWREEDVERVREMARNGQGASALDPSLQLEPGWEKEAVECLRVGYLCTARSLEKRPAMQQVVALLKDIRPDTTSSASFSC
ncbi:hypothetical protein HPP92_019609 [Vanilla planifolia]|uniref:Protein kinase domain-containing protein n=1 Tax=Vanilla planifolia TaxID=51239 RepID=A0A835ULW2_VANPL|nr:hypothetical protein HPP92_019609 [Vanilla planifolia]